MFEQGRTSVARTAPGAEYTRERMEICNASFPLKMICCYEMSQSVEVVSNLRPRKNLGEGSTHGLSTLTFGRTFSLFTIKTARSIFFGGAFILDFSFQHVVCFF